MQHQQHRASNMRPSLGEGGEGGDAPLNTDTRYVMLPSQVSQMYLEGYGIAVSESKSTYWKLTARANGARRLEGVYDRLD